LRPTGDATAVQVSDGGLISGGRFAETKQQIGGNCLTACKDGPHSAPPLRAWRFWLQRRCDPRIVRTIVTSRPVIIGFDGTPASERTVREVAALLAPRPAMVVVVWEAGLAFEAATTPAIEAPPVARDIQPAFDADQELYDAASRVAERGAALAVEAGLAATSLAIADDATVADTLIRIARENHARAIAVGTHSHRGISNLLLGSTSRDLLQHAPCPVVVVPDA